MLSARTGVTPLLSLGIIFLISTGVTGARRRHDDDADADDGSWCESVSRARCASRCLGLHSAAARSAPPQVTGAHLLQEPGSPNQEVGLSN